ncbi:GIY-YIG nuclease family protein [Spiroplasma taiwanense]|uniref:GIY-YIG domain-containing protein n=1 Tax=Spiroplasma taiwanense CT-1 TaxID=1276220 RepID=S5MIA4_9MOLU|nr:GIY-YIG nuclease family protein [Spiroplasma taiwanense]AGR41630.1 hypothetical protein STAIW_v1c10470 [Spiroplasma taiwanense CT-1]
MDLKNEYKLIWKIKTSRDLKYKDISEQYCKKIIQELIEKNKKIDIMELAKNKVAGVYLLYSIENKNLNFTYVGESKDLGQRIKQHLRNFNSKNRLYSKMRKKIISSNQINFLILDEIEDQNLRLMKETYYIYIFKSKFFNLNSKLVNKKLKCPNGHGNTRSYMTYDKNSLNLLIYIYGKCKNNECKEIFIIN